MPLNETLLDKYLRECRAFEIKYPSSFPYKMIPKDELQAQRDREKAIFRLSSPAERQRVLDINNDAIGHRPAVTEAPGFDGRYQQKEAA